MRNALPLVLGVVALTFLPACGDAGTATSGGSERRPIIPQDPSEAPGAPKDPDPSSPANPNSNAPPAPPTTPGTTTGQLEVALSTATPATDLGTAIDVVVTITPKSGFTGQVALTATGLPTGVTGTFVPATVTANTTAVTSKLTLTVPFTTIPSAPGATSALVVKATSGATEATANASFKVNPKITLTIPVNTTALLAAGGGAKNVDGWGGPTFGSSPVALQTQGGNGITAVFKNLDSTPRQFHADGIAHGVGLIAPGAVDPKSRVLDPAAADIKGSGYIHNTGGLNEGNGRVVGFQLIVKKAPAP